MASLQALNEKYMADACQILEDPEGHADDTWDEDLGEYTTPVTDDLVKYSGKCMLYEDSSPLIDENGGVTQQFLRYWCEVPVTVTDIPENAIIVVTASQDSDLVGKKFLVRAVVDETYAASRRLRISRRVSRPRA